MQAINVVPCIPGAVSRILSFVEQDPSFAQPTPQLLSLTEFYCQANGSNLNSGSDQNAAAKFTSTNGNWSTVTNTFIPTDGTNPVSAGVKVNDYASIYIDGATVSVFISRITAVVDAANGAITVLAGSGIGGVGVAPVTSATARSIKVGGAHLGPNAASGFPFTLSRWGDQRNVSGNLVRTSLKNDQTYAITAGFSVDSSGLQQLIQGYSVTPGDGAVLPGNTGKATIDGGSSTGAIISGAGNGGNAFRDLVFSTSISSGSTNIFVAGSQVELTRCVFKGARNNGLFASGVGTIVNECEGSNCNTSNQASTGCFNLSVAGFITRTIAHDSTGSNASGFIITGASLLQNVVCARIGQYGVLVSGNGNRISQSDFYRIGSDAIHISSGTGIVIENNNFVKTGIGGIPGGAGILNLSAGMMGFSYNNAYGSVGSGDTLLNIIESGKTTYPVDVTPWIDPDNGNFGASNTRAISTGRGAFTVTQIYSGTTTGYPDVGAAPRNDSYPSLDGSISGVTRDSSGNPLGSCTVHLFRTSDDLKLGTTTSDGSGLFTIAAPLNVACYLVEYLPGSPDVFGSSVNTLTGG